MRKMPDEKPITGAWMGLEAPWGRILVAATERGIAAIELRPLDEQAWAVAVGRRLGGRIVPDGAEEARPRPPGARSP
jgi:hypothetical protein